MNNVYFACRTCKTYQDAGYRWCYWTLEHPLIVQRGKSFSVKDVLSASEYWQGSEEAAWLQELLPRVRGFLERHSAHDLIYGDIEDIGVFPVTDDDYGFLDWMDEGENPDLLPRHFVERLGYDSWRQVDEHISRLIQVETGPWWWYFPGTKQKAEEKFISLAKSVKRS